MVRCPFYSRCACSCQRIWCSSITPIHGDSAIRTNAKHWRCAALFQTDINTGLAIIRDVQRADVHFAICGLEVSKRPVPALTGKPLMRWIIRQCGLCCQFFQRPRRDNRAIVVVKRDIAGGTGCSTATSLNGLNRRYKSVRIDQ